MLKIWLNMSYLIKYDTHTVKTDAVAFGSGSF